MRRVSRTVASRLPFLIAAVGACSPATDTRPLVGSPAPQYGARSLDGDSVSLAGFRGRAVLLNFWATWCAPCRQETPFLQSLYARFSSRGLVIVGVSMDTDEARDQVQEFVREFGVTYPVLVDPEMRGMETYKVIGLPASFLVDWDGILRWMGIGPVGETDRGFLRALETVLE